MEKVKINLKKSIDNSYEILLGKNIFDKVVNDLIRNKIGNTFLIITDENTKKIGIKLFKKLSKKIKINLITIRPGERSKTINVFNELMEKVYSYGLDRESAIIALGGGVVGDIAGFVAASYMRGINYVQVPTSLLAMVDSSIGGKVAVDLKKGKNVCGAFYQPKRVYIDVGLLETLPKKEMLNGMAEVIKHAIIADSELFSLLEKNVNNILKKDEALLLKMIKRNCGIKGKIVEKDEKERNLRKIVNFGHTMGHAIETLTGYKRYSHGEAISIGMVVESRIANRLGYFSAKDMTRITALFDKFGISTKLPKINADKIIKELSKDKKTVGGKVQFVLPEKIGRMKTVRGSYGINVPSKVILEALKQK